MHTDQAFSQDSWFEYARPSSITNTSNRACGRARAVVRVRRGYAWKFAHCQRCGTQVGWIFVPEGTLEHEHGMPDLGLVGCRWRIGLIGPAPL